MTSFFKTIVIKEIMVKLLKSDWEKILKKPQKYINDSQDMVIVKIIPATNPNNPTMLMVGRDEFDGRFYVVVEDNDSSEDIYPENGDTLLTTFAKIYTDLTRKDELLTLLYNASVNANVAPEFHADNGTVVELTQPVIDMINNILEQAYLPFIVDTVIDNGYRKKGDK